MITLVMKKNQRIISALCIVTAVCVLLASCGYRLSGTGDLVPEGVTTISIPVFINGTSEPYIDIELTRAVVNEFLVDGRLNVVNLERAELALHGQITEYQATALSYTSQDYVDQYKIRIVVNARLEGQRSKKVIWQESGIESLFISDYPVIYDPGGKVKIRETKITKEEANRKASKDMALTLRSRVLEGF